MLVGLFADLQQLFSNGELHEVLTQVLNQNVLVQSLSPVAQVSEPTGGATADLTQS